MSDLPNPSPELEEAYAALAFDDEPEGAKERVWAGVSKGIAIAAGTATVASAATASAQAAGTQATTLSALSTGLKLKVVALAIGCALGGATVGVGVDRAFLQEEQNQPSTPPETSPIPDQHEATQEEGQGQDTEAPEAEGTLSNLLADPAEDSPLEDAPSTEPTTETPSMESPTRRPHRQVSPPPTPVDPTAMDPSPPPMPASELARERTMVDAVRAAVQAGRAQEALRTIARHSREFPNGRLVEEREGLRIVALARLGRTDQANTLAARFRHRYPRSLLLPMIDSTLSTESAP